MPLPEYLPVRSAWEGMKEGGRTIGMCSLNARGKGSTLPPAEGNGKRSGA
jgi:hypothetical protein